MADEQFILSGIDIIASLHQIIFLFRIVIVSVQNGSNF